MISSSSSLASSAPATSAKVTFKDYGETVTLDVPLTAVLGRGGFDLDRIMSLEPEFLNPGHGEAGIDAETHRRRAGMRLPAGQRHLQPLQALAVGHDADVDAFIRFAESFL